MPMPAMPLFRSQHMPRVTDSPQSNMQTAAVDGHKEWLPISDLSLGRVEQTEQKREASYFVRTTLNI